MFDHNTMWSPHFQSYCDASGIQKHGAVAPSAAPAALLTWHIQVFRGQRRGFAGWDPAVFPPHFAVGCIAPGGCFPIRVATVVFLQVSGKEGTMSLAFQKAKEITKCTHTS